MNVNVRLNADDQNKEMTGRATAGFCFSRESTDTWICGELGDLIFGSAKWFKEFWEGLPDDVFRFTYLMLILTKIGVAQDTDEDRAFFIARVGDSSESFVKEAIDKLKESGLIR